MTEIPEIQLQHCPSNEYSGLISLKVDWVDLLAVQGTFRSLLQHHSSKASILWHSVIFTVQLSQPYVTTGKTTALIIQTVINRVMSLLFNTLSRFVIAFLPRSNRLLISWLQSPSAVILEPKKRKYVDDITSVEEAGGRGKGRERGRKGRAGCGCGGEADAASARGQHDLTKSSLAPLACSFSD